MPRVSVIIGNYNYARFLLDAIDSALGQTHEDVEVIVIDDGSTDESRSVIERYGSRIRAAFQPNGGMGSTYNAGFELCRGDAVIFLDADDVLRSHAAGNAAELLADPQVAKVHWPLWEVDASLAKTGHVVPAARDLVEGDLRDAMIERGPDAYRSPPTSGNAWSARFLRKVLPLPEAEFRQHADAYLFTLAPIYGRVARLQEPQSLYRVHGGNDYAEKPLDERNRRNLVMYDRRCTHLADHLARQNVTVPAGRWTGNNPAYRWMVDLDAALRELAKIVPERGAFILIDNGEWGSNVLSGRRAIPFTEKNGMYWGPPADDAAAMAELERLRVATRPQFLAVAQPAFWWVEHYAGFLSELRSRFQCVLDNDRLIVFRI